MTDEEKIATLQQQVQVWKDIAGKLARELGSWQNPAHDQYAVEILQEYEQALANQL